MNATLTAPPRPLPDIRTLRMAELVQHLTGCQPDGALRAIEATGWPEPTSLDDALEALAGAMVRLRHLDLRDVAQMSSMVRF